MTFYKQSNTYLDILNKARKNISKGSRSIGTDGYASSPKIQDDNIEKKSRKNSFKSNQIKKEDNMFSDGIKSSTASCNMPSPECEEEEEVIHSKHYIIHDSLK